MAFSKKLVCAEVIDGLEIYVEAGDAEEKEPAYGMEFAEPARDDEPVGAGVGLRKLQLDRKES